MKTPRRLRIAELLDLENTDRVEKIRSDIACRLRKACGHLSDEEFAVLVEKMMRVQLGGERRAH